jgi:hypothetical protein
MTQPPTNQQIADQVILSQRKLTLEARIRGGGAWFFWIAGLSVVNSMINFFGGTWTFFVGLGLTQFIDGFTTAFARDVGLPYAFVARLLGLSLDLAVAGLFVGAGLLARRRYRWVIAAGMLLYILDGLLFVWVAQWLNVVFHGLPILGLMGGLISINSLAELEKGGLVDDQRSRIAAEQTANEGSNRRSSFRALIIIVLFTCFIFILLAIFFRLTNGGFK